MLMTNTESILDIFIDIIVFTTYNESYYIEYLLIKSYLPANEGVMAFVCGFGETSPDEV